MEFGAGARDFVANPFGTFLDPHDPYATGTPAFDRGQARTFAYVAWSGEVYEGTAEDYEGYENLPIGPGARMGIEFSEEGFRLGDAGGSVHVGAVDLSFGGGGFVYYSDFNPHELTALADAQLVSAGPEALYGLGGDDQLAGGAHADRLDGGDDNDVLAGGGGIDRLFGGAGDDDLADGGEQGMLSGGNGDDVLRPGGGEDTIDGGDGTDRVVVDYSAWSDAIAFTLDPSRADHLFPDAYKRMTGVEAMTFAAGAGRDTLGGADGDDVLSGNGGSDVLRGGAGADRLFGGDWRDRLEGGAGDDLLDGGTASGPLELDSSGWASFNIDAEPDLLIHVRQIEMGSVGSTIIYGWQADFSFAVAGEGGGDVALSLSTIDGQAGDYPSSYWTSLYRIEEDGAWTWINGQDSYGGTLSYGVGEPGNYILSIQSNDDDPADLTVGVRLNGVEARAGDTMIGGTGNDIYVVDGVYDRVVEQAGEGTDTVVTSLASYTLEALPEIEGLTGDAGAQALTGNAGDNVIVSGGGADRLDGGGGDDRLIVSETPAHVEGGTGEDMVIVAADGNVALAPGLLSGVERFVVRDGGSLDLSALAEAVGLIRSTSTLSSATIVGTNGGDRIVGGAAGDALSGAGGDDLMVLDGQPATVNGGAGWDQLLLRGAAVYSFESGWIEGVELVKVAGGAVLDLGAAASGPDRIRLLAGGAQATGSAADDRIFGGTGDDVIAGGLGADVVTGGAGADRFIFALGDAARDRITDFSGSEGDRIDVSGLSGAGFTFLGSGAFTGAADAGAEIRVTTTEGGLFLVRIDLDHDARADASFFVHADDPITAGDFLF